MGELPLSEQDVDLLITALKSLLQRLDGREDFAVPQSSIQSMMGRLDELHGDERAQALAAIQKALSEIASELKFNGSDVSEADQD